MRKRSLVLVCGVALACNACAVGPEYATPQVDAGQGWSEPVSTDASNLSEWWYRFEDAELDRLVAQAQAENLSARQALSRVAEARAPGARR